MAIYKIKEPIKNSDEIKAEHLAVMEDTSLNTRKNRTSNAIKITGGKCRHKYLYDTMTEGTSISVVINGIACKFRFNACYGRYIVNGMDCDRIYFGDDDMYGQDVTCAGGGNRYYAIYIPENIIKSAPKENQKDFSFTGQYYSTAPVISYFKNLLKSLLSEHPEYFYPEVLDKLHISTTMHESKVNIEGFTKGDWVEVNLNTRKNGTPNIIPVKVDKELYHGRTFLGWAWGERQNEYPISAIVKKIDSTDTDEIIKKYTPDGFMHESNRPTGSQKYKNYYIVADPAGDGYNVFDIDKNLEDEGYGSVEDAKAFIDTLEESFDVVGYPTRSMSFDELTKLIKRNLDSDFISLAYNGKAGADKCDVTFTRIDGSWARTNKKGEPLNRGTINEINSLSLSNSEVFKELLYCLKNNDVFNLTLGTKSEDDFLEEGFRYKGLDKTSEKLTMDALNELETDPGKVYNYAKFDIFYGENKDHYPFNPCYYIKFRPSGYTSMMFSKEHCLKYINDNNLDESILVEGRLNGSYDKTQLENDLLALNDIDKVDWDLSAYDELGEIIVLTHRAFEDSLDMSTYYMQRTNLLREILKVFDKNNLKLVDPIEDQGTWWYFVLEHKNSVESSDKPQLEYVMVEFFETSGTPADDIMRRTKDVKYTDLSKLSELLVNADKIFREIDKYGGYNKVYFDNYIRYQGKLYKFHAGRVDIGDGPAEVSIPANYPEKVTEYFLSELKSGNIDIPIVEE